MSTSPSSASAGHPWPPSDQFPLGRPYGLVSGCGERASLIRPFGMRRAVTPRHVAQLRVADLGYDEVAQIGLVREGGTYVPWLRHTDGQTGTVTNADGHGGRDSDVDHRED